MIHTGAMEGTGERPPADPAVVAPPEWITVASGTRGPAELPPVRTGRIVLQVVAAAAFVVVLVSVLGAVASRKVAEREAVNDAASITGLLADAVVQPALDDALVTLDPAAIVAFDAVIREHVLGPSIVRVKVWTPDGLIVYSDEPRVIGETFALGEDERDVLTNPMTRAEISDLSRPENRFETGQELLLEVYRPVWTPSGQALLFETYSPYDPVTARSGELWRGFAGITLTSLLLLVVLLVPVLWRLLDRLRPRRRSGRSCCSARWMPRPRSAAASRRACTTAWSRSSSPRRSRWPVRPSRPSPTARATWPAGSAARPPRCAPASAACARCSSTSTRRT